MTNWSVSPAFLNSSSHSTWHAGVWFKNPRGSDRGFIDLKPRTTAERAGHNVIFYIKHFLLKYRIWLFPMWRKNEPLPPLGLVALPLSSDHFKALAILKKYQSKTRTTRMLIAGAGWTVNPSTPTVEPVRGNPHCNKAGFRNLLPKAQAVNDFGSTKIEIFQKIPKHEQTMTLDLLKKTRTWRQ